MTLKTLIYITVISMLIVVAWVGVARAEWQNFDKYDGLASEDVHAIIEDSSGDFWIGTWGGVNRYDGVSWTTYTSLDGLVSNLVNVVIEDSSGNLWFGMDDAFGSSRGGVSRYDGESWTTYTTADGLAGEGVFAILEDSSGALWFGTSGGVSRYDNETWTNYTTEGGLAGNRVRGIIEDSSGALWFGADGGVSRYDNETWTNYTTADGLVDNSVWAILEDSSGALWFGTSGGVSRYDGASWTTFRESDGLANNYVLAILEDSSGALWFGTSGGVSRYDGARWSTYIESDGLASNRVYAIIEDRLGALWFGTIGGGVSRYDGVSWMTYTASDGLAGDQVQAIIQDDSSALWFGTGQGVSRYDGVSWTTFTIADGLAHNNVLSIIQDSSGAFWFGTGGSGVSRYDGVSWRTYSTYDGLAFGTVTSILEDGSGDLWFGTYGGVSRFDGVNWTTYRESDGLVDDEVLAILEDSSGALWFGTYEGVSRFDGVNWTTYRESDGLAGRRVYAVIEDSSGAIWLGTGSGVSRYDGVNWNTFRDSDGLVDNYVYAIFEDSSGDLWFGTRDWGVSRYNGEFWATYTDSDGLAHSRVRAIFEDGSKAIWFGTSGGVTVHEPDRIAPQTVVWPEPPDLPSGTTMNVGFTTAFKETEPVAFSHSLDGSAWSEWSAVNSWTGTHIADGEHQFAVRVRDRVGNVDATPAIHAFEIDGTAPSPVISSPLFEQAVRDSVLIVGTAGDTRFKNYIVQARSAGATAWELLAESSIPVYEGVLAGWNTASEPDGFYEVRVSELDTLGLTGTALVKFEVDNEAPWAFETTPAIIEGPTGGDVYTTDREVHLYFPPHAFRTGAEVRIEKLSDIDVPDTLAGGALRVDAGYEISWDEVTLGKAATLELSYGGAQSELPGGALALFASSADSTWRRLGGTLDASAKRISAPITEPGSYSLFLETDAPVEAGGLSSMSITPRVFSPSGGFAARRAAIGFTLGRPGRVTVKIFNRAGRLVSEVSLGDQMAAGANLVHWDGRSRDGSLVGDGVYLVTVEALGQKLVKPLAVVR